ncbi:MAG: PAS domain-containing protein [Arenimonas sp.]|nr:PAS domain-containing protein [Arenimonas sp.]
MHFARIATTLFILLMLASSTLHAEEINTVRFQQYGVDDGLSQTTVRALFQDKSGFIWLGTQDGLNRFDGYEFRIYRNDPSNLNSLSDNHVVAIVPDSKNGFWVGTQSAGLSHYNPINDNFQRFQAGGKIGDLADNGISALKLDAKKLLWVATNSGNLQWFNEKQNTFQKVPTVNFNEVGRVKSIKDFRQGLLLGTRNGIFFLANNTAALQAWPTHSPLTTEIETITQSLDGKEIWVATLEQGLFHYSTEGELIKHYKRSDGLADNNVRDLKFDRTGRLWIATFDGLSRIDSARSIIKTWRYNQGLGGSLASSRIQSLMQDRDGLMWIGTWLNGVSLYIPQTEIFQEITSQSTTNFALPASSVPGLFVDNDSTIWLGILEGGGLVHYDLRNGVLKRFVNNFDDPTSLPAGAIQNIVRDKQGRLWVATGSGLAKLNADGQSFEIFKNEKNNPKSLPYSAIQRLFVDAKGTLWIGTAGGGIASRCETCTDFKRHPIPDESNTKSTSSNEIIAAIFEDSQSQLWFGLRPGGLVKLNPATGVIQRFRGDPQNKNALSHDTIAAIFEDSRQHLWIGTQGGLNRTDLNAKGEIVFKHYNMKSGLAANAIGGIVEDQQGDIWVSTTTGLSRLNIKTNHIENFGSRDGAQGLGYFVGSYGKLNDGRILFGGMRGVTVFNPKNIGSQTKPNRAEITAIRVLKSGVRNAGLSPFVFEKKPEGGNLLLEALADDINIEFSALSYTDPNALHYAYRMLGVHEEWFETDAMRRTASFNNLAPGDYQFEVKAKNPDGQWGDVFQMPIQLPAPWYATLWSKLLYLILTLIVLGGFTWNVLLRLRERARAQAIILESEQQLKLTLWGTGDELWDLDLVGNLIHRSNPLLILKGSTGEVSHNANALMKYVHPDDTKHFEASLRDHLKGKTDVVDTTFRSEATTGGWRWIRMRGRVVERDASGKALRVVGTSGDITDLKQHEIDLAEINAQLEQRVVQRTSALSKVNQNLQETIEQLTHTQKQLVESEKLAALGGLVAGVAHEINTPVGIGVTAASFLESEVKQLEKSLQENTLSKSDLEKFSKNASDSSQLILRNLYRADKLIRSFKQVAVDQSSEQTRVINLHSYVEEILVSLHPAVKKTPHEVHLHCTDILEFETYPGAIYQILVNLMMNALTHAFQNTENGKIDICISRDDDMALIEFRDNGYGMTDVIRRRVFDPFFTTRRGEGGSGLGLHIAWNLATQLLGGSLSCESEVGKGTSFYLRIPMQVSKKR